MKSERSKIIRSAVQRAFDLLVERGFHRLERGRVARAKEHTAQVVEIEIESSRSTVRVRFGVAVYNTNCQHLHAIMNGEGQLLRFTCEEERNERDASRLLDYLDKEVLPGFERMTEKDLLEHPACSEQFKGELNASLKGDGNTGLIETNKAYWHGKMKHRNARFGKNTPA